MTEQTISWTEERVSRLTKMWGEGLSAATIAHCLGGVSRNAVIGKVTRLGLSGRKTTQTHLKNKRSVRLKKAKVMQDAKPRQPASAKVFNLHAEPLPATIEVLIPHGQAKTIIELENHHCRYPLGNVMDVATHFCGGTREPGLPYCAPHCRISFRPPEQFRRHALGSTERVTGAQNASRGGEGSQNVKERAGELVEAE